MERLTYTVSESAELLGISRSTAYELVRNGDLPSLRLGRRIVIVRCAFESLLGGAASGSALEQVGGEDRCSDASASALPARLDA